MFLSTASATHSALPKGEVQSSSPMFDSMFLVLFVVVDCMHCIRISVRSADESPDKEMGPKGDERERDMDLGSGERRGCYCGAVGGDSVSNILNRASFLRFSSTIKVIILLCSWWIICFRSLSRWSSGGEWIRGRTTPGQWRNVCPFAQRGWLPHLSPSSAGERERERHGPWEGGASRG